MKKVVTPAEAASEMRGICETLRGDLKRLDAVLSQSQDDQFYRRALVRTVWAYVEGCSYGLKRVTLAIADYYAHDLGPDLRTFLVGQSRPQGMTTDHPLFDAWSGPVWNAVHALASCTSLLALEHVDVLKDREIEVMKQSVKVRDRLAHPKTNAALRVTDGELSLSRESFHAFDCAWVGVQRAILSRKKSPP